MPQNKKKGNKKGNRRSPNKNKNRSPQNKNKNASHNNATNGKSPNNANKKNNNNNQNESSSKTNPSNSSSSTNNNTNSNNTNSQAQILKNSGNSEFQNGNYQKAIEYYSKAIDLEPNSQAYYSNRSAAYKQSGKYELALNDADKCIEIAPKWSKGYVRKGTVLCAQNKLIEAEEMYRVGLEQCDDKAPLKKATDNLENLKIAKLDKNEKIVGGHHGQSDKFRTLINWLLQGGAKFPKLYLKFYSPEYRAIHAMGRIEKDEDICYIPHDYIMTSDVAKLSEIGQAIINSKVELRSKHSYLASYLLQERELGIKSKWNVYITILPKKFETIPLFFNDEQRAWLTGSISIKKIDDRLESLRLEHESLCNAIPSFSRFALSDFIWARLVVITRIFGLVINDIKTDGLVPMADMLNHRRPRETKWTYSQKKRGFLITSLKNITENSEIFDSYGRKCNSRFFVNYGFSLEFNLDNECLMKFSLPSSDVQYAIKARHLGFNNIINNSQPVAKDFQIPKAYKEKKVKECYSWLRILHAQGNEFLIISSADGLRLEDIPPLSIRNECQVLTSLAVSATKSLKKFINPLQKDNLLLQDFDKYPMYSNQRNAVLMRRGEKEVLHHYIDLMKICINLFKNYKKFKDLKNKLRKDKKFKDQDSPLMQYINNVVVPLIQRQSN